MPQFILDLGTPEAGLNYIRKRAFVRGYVEAMFFTETGCSDDGDMEHATVAELSNEAWERIVADCDEFERRCRRLLDAAYQRDYDEEQAGRDFWFTRNGHGVGFWDREQLREGGLGERLSKYCG